MSCIFSLEYITMANYKDLEIYQTSIKLEDRVFKLTLKLPDYEKYELGSQIRRSSSGIRSCIAEGYGRRTYKKEFIRFLIYSISSCDETTSHLEVINMRYPEFNIEKSLYLDYSKLGIKINNYIKYVQNNWNTY